MGLIPDSAAPAGESSAAAAPDVSGDSSSSNTDVSSDSGADVFADQDFSSTFGLQPEEKQADVDDTPDVKKVTDPPVPRQDTEVEKDAGTKEVEASAETAETDDTATKAKDDTTDAPEKDGQLKLNEKLNWEDDKVPFREEFKNLKNAYMALLEGSIDTKYLNNPTEFLSWMKETSPTSYNEVGKAIVEESAQNQPKEWTDYLVQNNPDLVAESISGREGMTADRLKAELAVLLDEDDEDVQAKLEEQSKAQAKDAKPEETPEQKRVREILDRDERAETQRGVSETFQPVYSAVDALFSEAGLEIKESEIAGKAFEDLDPDIQFKVMANELNAIWINKRVAQNPQLRAMQDRLEQFIEKKDWASAKKLQHPLTIAATNITGEFLRVLTGKRAATKKSETQIPAKDIPKAMVKSAGGNGFTGDDTGAKPFSAEGFF